jgi:hypothetical protein
MNNGTRYRLTDPVKKDVFSFPKESDFDYNNPITVIYATQNLLSFELAKGQRDGL